MQNQGEMESDDDMLPEYDFTDAEVGRYFERYGRALRRARLDPDVAEVFPAYGTVNEVRLPRG